MRVKKNPILFKRDSVTLLQMSQWLRSQYFVFLSLQLKRKVLAAKNTQEFKRILKKLGENKINFDSTVAVIKKKDNAYEYC